MLITHDLGVVADMAQKVLVMYAGKVVEYADTIDIFSRPLHPYTEGLLKSIPRLNQSVEKLHVIDGMVPSLSQMPKGCRFCPRCEYATKYCQENEPPMLVCDNRKVRCWRYKERQTQEAAT